MHQVRQSLEANAIRSRPALLAACCAVNFLFAVYLGALGVLMPAIGASFGLSSEVQGRLFPASYIGSTISVLVCGYLSDRWGRRLLLRVTAGMYALGLTLFGLAPLFSFVLLASLLIGGGTVAMQTVANALAAELYPARRAQVLNATQIAFGAGAALSPFCFQALMNSGVGWRALYFGLAAVVGALLLALLVLPIPAASGSRSGLDFASLRALIRQPLFVLLCLTQALYAGADVAFFSWMPTYFRERVSDGSAWAGLVVSLYWGTITVGRIGTGFLLERFSPARLRFVMGLGAALFSTLALLSTRPLPILICVSLTGLAFSGLFSVILTEASARFTSVLGTAFGGIVAVGNLGIALFPWLVGVLAKSPLDWRGALLLVPLLSLTLSLLALRKQTQMSAEQP